MIRLRQRGEKMNRILVVEDDEAISSLICLNLGVAGYGAVPAFDGPGALEKLGTDRFDLALLDVMLPGMDGFALFPYVSKLHIPVIYLTAVTDTQSKIKGLRQAEDYIVKPFDILELLVRIEKVLRRTGRFPHVFRAGSVELDEQRHIVTRNGQAVSLKPLEFSLLLTLMKNKNIALSRDFLLADVWGTDFMGESRTVDVHIGQLRKKLGLSIATIPKVGYRLED